MAHMEIPPPVSRMVQPEPEPEHRTIMADELGRKLMDAGVVPASCRRIIIDLELGQLPRVFVECIGDSRMLEVDFVEGLKGGDVLLVKEIPDEREAEPSPLAGSFNKEQVTAKIMGELTGGQGVGGRPAACTVKGSGFPAPGPIADGVEDQVAPP